MQKQKLLYIQKFSINGHHDTMINVKEDMTMSFNDMTFCLVFITLAKRIYSS